MRLCFHPKVRLRNVIWLVSFLCVALAWFRWSALNVESTFTRIEELSGSILSVDNSIRIPGLPYPYEYAFAKIIEVDFSIRGDELYPPLPGLVTDQDLLFIGKLRDLEALNLDNNRITDAGMEYVGKMRSLKDISLAFTDITDEGVEDLRELDLESLTLDFTNISDRSMVVIGGFGNLRDVCINGTAVTDIGLEQLARLENLRMLEVRDTEVTDDGLERLRAKFPSLCLVR